jgi:glycosyltransferase involved in cell wall biosynthesis
MRVLFMTTRDPQNPGAAGGDIQAWEYARYLASSGHQVTFLTSYFPGAPTQASVDGILVVRLGGVLSLWWQTCLYYLRHCRGQFDVVVEEGFGGSRIPRLAPLYVTEPIVTEWHQVHRDLLTAEYGKCLGAVFHLMERFTVFIHRNCYVRVGTEGWRKAFTQIGFKVENVFVVPVSLREEWLVPPASSSREKTRTVIWLGKFRRYKCPHHAIEAMTEVITHVPEARLILAGRHGDLRYERQLRHAVNKAGLSQYVEFTFDLDEVQKKSRLAAARVLVLPSSVEGFGIVVLEANACGTPVVASSGVPEEVVRHGYNGLRYRFADIGDLARNVVRLLKDDGLHARLSRNGLTFVERFAWRRVGVEYERAVKMVVSRRAAHAGPTVPRS